MSSEIFWLLPKKLSIDPGWGCLIEGYQLGEFRDSRSASQAGRAIGLVKGPQ